MPDIGSAMNAITSLKQTSVAVIGLPTPVILVVVLSPLLAFGIVYTFYQRAFVLTKVEYTSSVPWVFEDVLRKSDLTVAYALAWIPLMTILIVNFLFADVQGYGLSIPYIGHIIDIRAALGIERWVAGFSFYELQKERIAQNAFGTFVMILFLVSVFMSVKIMLFLWKITAENRALLKGE